MGKYVGEPIVKFLDDGRLLQLMARFSFVDRQSLSWDVPVGAQVDGASIPRFLWTFVGGPLEGRYRNASIIHDWYCCNRTRSWESVHSVFYEAMLVSGVPTVQANIMYAGVRYGGPKWPSMTVHNANLAMTDAKGRPMKNGAVRGPAGKPVPPPAFVRETDESQFSKMVDIICKGEHTPQEIEALVDTIAPDKGRKKIDF
jgi:Protein of unknown function (DUF1353)